MSEDASYNVVLKALTGSHKGVMTRTSFADKAEFDGWYDKTMQDGSGRPISSVYAVVAEGVSDEVAGIIIASPGNTNAVLGAMLGQAARNLREVTCALK